MKIILGSNSPRRAEILHYFSLPFRIIASNFDEDTIPFLGDAAKLAKELSLAKLKALAALYPKEVILTADTVVAIDGITLGKPKDDKESLEMLSRLSGRWHSVITAVSTFKEGKFHQDEEETRVLCNNITPDEMHRYVRKHSLQDKAGGYAIQKSGSLLVKRIDGCYYNVLGLPINATCEVLKKVGIDLWEYLKEFE